MAKLIKINILHQPLFKKYNRNEPFTAANLLCECVYDDGSKEYLFHPYIEVPKMESGTHEVRIYKSEDEKDVYASYEIEVDKLEYDVVRGMFKYEDNFFYYNDNQNAIACNRIEEYSTTLIYQVQKEAKKMGINLEFVEEQ